MAKMKAVQVTKANAPFEVVERDIPEPDDNQVRVKVEACGMCHSDAFVKTGGFPGLQLPRIPGHEVAGKIDKVGAKIKNFKVGDKVGVGWHGGHCWTCNACRAGMFINCENGKVTGISYDGGYAEYLVVPQEAVARVPDGMDPVDVGPLMCAGVTTYNALRNSGARPGDTVAVQGIGGLGHLGIQYAAQMGFRTVALSRGANKEELARKLGAHEYIDSEKGPVAEALMKLGGADVVLCTAPNEKAIEGTFGGIKARGKLLLVAAPFGNLSFPAFPLLSGKSIAGWPSGTAYDSQEAVAFSKLHGVKAMVEKFPFEKAEEAYAKVMDAKVRFRAVLVP